MEGVIKFIPFSEMCEMQKNKNKAKTFNNTQNQNIKIYVVRFNKFIFIGKYDPKKKITLKK